MCDRVAEARVRDGKGPATLGRVGAAPLPQDSD